METQACLNSWYGLRVYKLAPFEYMIILDSQSFDKHGPMQDINFKRYYGDIKTIGAEMHWPTNP